jgi:hypothetical protein
VSWVLCPCLAKLLLYSSLFFHQVKRNQNTISDTVVAQVPKNKLSTQADIVCTHTCYEIGLSYDTLTDPRWCKDRYLNKSCANSSCKHKFVFNIKDDVGVGNKPYKPSNKRPLYECLNGKECEHAFCKDCWEAITKKEEAENGSINRRSKRSRN